MSEQPDISVAIPTYLREEYLIETIGQILALEGIESAELLVMDQTPEHSSAVEASLQKFQADGLIRRERLPSPSLTKARNRALAAAKSQIVLFIDDDVILPRGFLKSHLRAHASSDAAIVGGQVYHCLDHQKPPPLEHPTFGTRPDSALTRAGEARGIIGCNHSVKRDIALKIGGYDDAFVGSALAEDMDFARRVILAGYKIYYDPEAWLVHLRVPSGGCAVIGTPVWPEWNHSSGLLLYAMRHGREQGNCGTIMWMALRNGPLRREILASPSRWVGGWAGFWKAWIYARKNRVFRASGLIPPPNV